MKTAAPSPSLHEPSIFDLRKRVRRRAWICPGAGYAAFRRPLAAAITYYSSVLTMLAAIVFAWSPSREWFVATIVLLLIGLVSWLMEIFATYTQWTTAEELVAAPRYRGKSVLLWLLVVVFAVVVGTGYRVIEIGIDGNGMAPTIYEGDRLLYRRGASTRDLTPGAVILFRLSSESRVKESGNLVVARILAGPNDLMQIRDGMYYVNDKPVRRVGATGSYPTAVKIVGAPSQSKIPDDRYFVVQDSSEDGLDSRVLALAQRDDILSTNLYSLNWGRLFKRIQ